MIPDSSDWLQMVDHTLIGQCLPGFLVLQRHCKVMCVSSPIYPVIIGNVRCACQMLPDPDWKAEGQRGARARTSAGNNHDSYATRYPEAVPLKKITTEAVAEALLDIYSRVGILEEVFKGLGLYPNACRKYPDYSA